MAEKPATKHPRLEALKRMRADAMHRYALADANAKRAKCRLSAAIEDLNILGEIIRTMEGNGGN